MLVDATFHAIADVGSIPTVSTPTLRRFGFQIGDRGVFLVVDPLDARRGPDSGSMLQAGAFGAARGPNDSGRPGPFARAAGVLSAGARYAQVSTSEAASRLSRNAMSRSRSRSRWSVLRPAKTASSASRCASAIACLVRARGVDGVIRRRRAPRP